MYSKKTKNKGFTLVEMLIAVSLFIVVVVISLGSILTIFDANRKAQSTKTVVDNLNLSVEDMTRVVRYGSNYHCGSTGTLSSPIDCSAGDGFLAVTFNGSIYVFRLNGTALQLSSNGGSSYINMTSSDTVIQSAKFYVFNSGTSGSKQPYVVVAIKGYVGSKATSQTSFFIETLMSQRSLDI